MTLVLTNRSTRPCRLYGYGGLQLLDAAGSPLPTRQIRVPQPRPQLIRLAPGVSALSTLYWVSLPMDKPCVHAAALLVTPPDETGPIRTGVLGPVCEQGRIQQTAYTAGSHVRRPVDYTTGLADDEVTYKITDYRPTPD